MKHKHHIIPKHMGGSDEPSNLIEISVEEHAEAHRVLYEKYGNWQDYLAWQGLSKRVSCEQMAREASRFANTGKKLSEETKQKISNSKKGVKHTPEHVKNNSLAQKGKVLSNEHKTKISSALSGRSLSESHKKNVGKKMKGRIMNEDWRKKLSDAAKERHARNRKAKQSATDGFICSENKGSSEVS